MTSTGYLKTTAELDLFGERRTVDVSYFQRPTEIGNAHIVGFVGSIGRGTARYPVTLTLFPLGPEQRPHGGNSVVTDADGHRWEYHLSTCIRNRQGRIVGWADTAGVTNAWDQTRA